ncbi:MAG TPA: hypothetical protein VGX28_01725 [Frankiaceae bacterium]|jgi:hypothetical protein|nr:hypothetical protein [Frankiaceae bacterium]
MDSQALADLVLADLESVVDRARTAYVERVPKIRQLDSATLDRVVEATRRTMREFCRYYIEGTLDSAGWRTVRDATMERAGEVFTYEEILEIVDIAKQIGLDTIEDLTAAHPDLPASERAKLTKALERYVTELSEQEDRLRRLANPARLDAILSDLENEGADLA